MASAHRAEAAAADEARGKLGKLTGPEELSAYAQLDPSRVDEIRDLLLSGSGPGVRIRAE